MKRTKQILSNTLNAVDIFEDPVHFNMSGNITLTSSLGGALSLAIIVFLAVQAIIQTVGMFSRDDPRLLQMDEFEDEPSRIYLNKQNNFVIAVSMTRDNAPIDLRTNSLMSFTSSFNQYIRSADGTQTKIKASISWAPCNKSDFPSPTFPANTFSTYSLEYAYCPTMINYAAAGVCPDVIRSLYPDCKTPPQFDVQGTFLSQNFEFINFKLKTCSPADSNYIYGLQCTSEDINTVFANSEIQLNLYFANTLIDPVNYDTPNKTFLDTIYWNIHPSVSTAADIFVDTETVQDFHDYFSNDKNDNRTFYSIDKGSTRELRKFKATSLLEWNLRRSNLNHITSRTYTKILDVISNIGGMSELFMLLGAFIALGYTRFKYLMILGNKLYDFQPTDIKKKPDLDLSRSPLIALTRLGDISFDEPEVSRNRFSFGLPKLKNKAKSEAKSESAQTVKEYFEQMEKRKRTLSYSQVSYIKYLIKSLFKLKEDPEEIMAKKAMNQVTQDLDIIKVVEKIKEIDKLKMLLLNPDQRKAFDFIEKPLFIMDKATPLQAGSLTRIEEGGKEKIGHVEIEKSTYTNDHDSLSDYTKLYITYRKLKDDPDIENIKYNQRLMEMIGEELRVVFQQVDKVMGPMADPKKFEEIVQQMINQQELTTLHNDRSSVKEDSKELSIHTSSNP